MGKVKYVLESRIAPAPWLRRRTVGRLRMLAEVRLFSYGKGGSRLRGRGTDFGPWRTGAEAVRRLRKRTAFNDAGYKIFIQRRSDFRTLSVHKIEETPEKLLFPVGNVHPEIQKGYNLLAMRFRPTSIRNGGTYFCRFVDGTTLVSRHGYRSSQWEGAAGDIFSNPDTMDALREKADFLVSEAIAGRLMIDRVIVGDEQWNRGEGWSHYSGDFHRHIHFEVHSGGPCR